MAIELIRFLGGALLLLIPGICLARVLSLGKSPVEIFASGSSLGLAMAVYLACALSHLDLRAFYPVWAIVGIACLAAWIKSRPAPSDRSERALQIAMLAILLLVAIIRFAMALPHVLPPGSLDPTFHLILAKQIQVAHHSIDRWPFADIPLNYPTGSHTLVVILSTFSGLPLHTTFKDLIPFLGVLTTAQIYAFVRRLIRLSIELGAIRRGRAPQAGPLNVRRLARVSVESRISSDPRLALYSAAIYGLWAWYGSIDYFRWGGLPNELAMLLFLAMLTLCLESIPRNQRGRESLKLPGNLNSILPPALCFAATLLVHHHVMVVGSLILAPIILWQILHHLPWKSLAVSAALGLLLDAFFLLPYAAHLSNLHSTGMVAAGEPPLPLTDLPQSFGYALTLIAFLGILLSLTRRIKIHPVVAIASLSLLAMFVIGEDIIPLTLRLLHKTAFTFFTPSRFLTDLNYFLPIFAAGAILFIQQKLRLAAPLAIGIILVGSFADFQHWIQMFTLEDFPTPVITACDWIQHNTRPSTLVDNNAAWMTYLCWREPAHIALPVSEPTADYHPAAERIAGILDGTLAPVPPDLHIVAIGDPQNYTGQPILWQDSSGLLVIQEWPITTSSSSAAVTPAQKPPGQPLASAPVSP